MQSSITSPKKKLNSYDLTEICTRKVKETELKRIIIPRNGESRGMPAFLELAP